MRALLKKEWDLCLHPTCMIFTLFSLFVFIPNYPYEVMFFFSGLSVFFVCLTARENGDAAFTGTLPVGRERAVLARMLLCALFQAILLCLAGIFTAIKECTFPAAAQINMAGCSANLTFLGYGMLLLGLFHVIFFPLYYRNPNKVGIPFVVAGAVQFAVIALLIVLRFTVPFFAEVLSAPDPAHMGEKAVAFALCLLLYLGMSAFGGFLAARRFARVDL